VSPTPGAIGQVALVAEGVYEYALGMPEAIGGAERQQWLLARALVSAGWSVTVGVPERLRPGERHVVDGVTFRGLDRGSIVTAWGRFLAAERPDWWYWRTASHLWGPATAMAKLLGVRTIFAASFDSDVRPRRALWRRSRWWPLYAWGLAQSNRIFLQHRGQLGGLHVRWRAKAHVVPSIAGCAVTVVPHAQRRPCVAWVGMLRRPKRPDRLVEIAQKAPAAHFVVCGAPSAHRSPSAYGDRVVGELRALPNVEYLGQIPPTKVEALLRGAAVMLSTADEEGFPNTFLQAWSSGTPVVSLEVDPDHVIATRGLGIVAGGTEGAVSAIASLIDTPALRDEIGARAARHVADAHSPAVVTAAFQRALG
jgi:glycosyltransferase involved in cell wall biosynthesis